MISRIAKLILMYAKFTRNSFRVRLVTRNSFRVSQVTRNLREILREPFRVHTPTVLRTYAKSTRTVSRTYAKREIREMMVPSSQSSSQYFRGVIYPIWACSTPWVGRKILKIFLKVSP